MANGPNARNREDVWKVIYKSDSMRVALLFAAAATAADWPSFRGPNGSGLTQGAAPLEIGPSKNVAWRIELPPGNSSPVLTTDAIFLTAYSDKDLLTLKIDRATGRIAWRRAVPAQRHDERHKLNNAASPTPVTDGRNVYSFFAESGNLLVKVPGIALYTCLMIVIGGFLGGAASVIYGLYINTIGFQMGFQNGLYAFTAAVLGGIGNIPGAALGGLLLDEYFIAARRS